MENNQLLKLMGLLEKHKNLIGNQTIIIEELTKRILRLEERANPRWLNSDGSYDRNKL